MSFLFFLYRLLRKIALGVLDRSVVDARRFSNRMLRKYAPIFFGAIINVSGWDDRDKEGNYYSDYFKNKSSYHVSNAPSKQKGFGSMSGTNIKEIELDLEQPLEENLRRKFDVVFNHTTLEHIFDFWIAFKNICDMSKDAVILVVPVIQNIHIKSSYGDYFRPTTLGIAKMFKKHGLEPLVIKTNDQPFSPVYCFALGVRDKGKYIGKIDKDLDFQMGKYLYGNGLKDKDIDFLLNNDK